MTPSIEFDPAFALPAGLPIAGPFARLAERLLGFDALNLLHRSLRGERADAAVRRALDALRVGVEVVDRERNRIPTRGSALVVANLPNGLLDGLALAQVLLRVRDDVRLLVARRERRLPELGDLLFELDSEGHDPTRNARVLRAAIRHVRNGGLLALFPANDTADLPIDGATQDGPWESFVATIARRARAPVTPIFMPRVERSFVRARLLRWPRLRRVFEPGALLAGRGATIRPRVGHALPTDSFERFEDDRELTAYFRLRTGLLARGGTSATPTNPSSPRELSPIATEISSDVLAREVERLLSQQPSARLCSAADLDAILAPAASIPNLLLEIGRLRERTFRSVGEGCGLERDLDSHDTDYRHLFLWDRVNRRVIGAYRLGLTDELLAKRGVDGLYTHSLFEFAPAFVTHVTPGIELGRAFIVAEAQRSHLPLDLLWRGIGAFVAANPRYSRVFGPVSISAAYCGLSRELIVEHIKHHQFDDELARSVRARTPPRRFDSQRLGLSWTKSMVEDVSEVSRMVTDIERDDKAMPILVREYLKLGGTFVGFNLDASFGDCLDGLVVVDLRKMPAKYRRRYLGSSRFEPGDESVRCRAS